MTLFWSERGEISCKDHAPYKGSDTWQWERWQKMTDTERIEFAKHTNKSAECETCGGK